MPSKVMTAPVALGLREKIEHRLFDSSTGSNGARPTVSIGSTTEQRQGSTNSKAAVDHASAPPPREIVVVKLTCPAPEVLLVEPFACHIGWDDAHISASTSSSADSEGLQFNWLVELQQVESTGNQGTAALLDSLNESKWETCYSGPNQECKVITIKPGRTYAARIHAQVERAQEGTKVEVEPSIPKLLTTPPVPPSTPSPPALSSRERKALKLKWNPPEESGGAGPLQYVLYMTPPPQECNIIRDTEGFVEAYRGPEKAQKIGKLLPGTRYTFKVKAINRVGESPISLCSAFTTQATVPSQPEPPVAVQCTENSITLQWTPPPDNGSAIVAYTLERDDGLGGDFHLAYAGIGAMFTASGLTSGLPYKFRLRADNDEGKSNWSNPLVATTAARPPQSPQTLALVSSSRTSATLSWHPPQDTGGSPVLLYEVQLQAKSKAAVDHMGNEWLRIFEGSAQACTINSLRPGCTYRARVRAVNAAGWGQFGIPVDIQTAPDVPEAPGAPVMLASTPVAVSLQWHPPLHNGGAKITSYRVEMCCQGPNGSEQAHSASAVSQLVYHGDDAVAEVQGLQPGHVYSFRIQAVNSQGAGSWSDWGSVCTAAAAPRKPVAPAVASSSSSSISLHWVAPDGQGAPVHQYILDIAMLGYQGSDGVLHKPLPPPPPASSSPPDTEAAEANGSAAHVAEQPPQSVAEQRSFKVAYKGSMAGTEVKGLEASTRYCFRLTAVNVAGSSPLSELTTALTAPASPGPPEAVQVEATSSLDLMVCWQRPHKDFGAAVMSYHVDVAPGVSPSKSARTSQLTWTEAASTAGHEVSCTVGNLLPGRLYHVRVRAANSCGTGPPSMSASAATLPAVPEAPRKISFSQRASASIRVKWDAPIEDNGAPVVGYQVEMASGEGTSYELVYSGKDEVTKLGGLQPGTKYWVRVAAVNSAGVSPYSASEAFTTMLAPPAVPEEVEATEVGLSPAGDHASLVLRWQPPAPTPAAAVPASYEVMGAPIPDTSSGVSSASSSLGAIKQMVGKQCECRLERLLPGTCYSFQVRAIGAEGAGHGAWSTAVQAATPGQRRGDFDARSVASSDASALVYTAPSASHSNKQKKKAMMAAYQKRGNSSAGSGSEDGSAPGAPAARKTVGAAKLAKARGPPVKKTMWTTISGSVNAFCRQNTVLLVFLIVAILLTSILRLQLADVQAVM